MTFIPQESYSKKDLVECGNGALFTKDGDGRLPSDQMLMFDEIISINDFDGEFGKGKIVANLKINPDLWFFLNIDILNAYCGRRFSCGHVWLRVGFLLLAIFFLLC